ncbi:GspE/PulE family protein [Simiduia agarivorans]|uniref:MSHA biogenesis protein MshE n=1 Tax=Simiduia agarivorans (strain DSM 21679 / JCM 13881 / BCRC 17597 / SA1) TaxID=1117647 RepID=K4KIN1_SIMAS|nr:GspE/PulE family protein [Simiduia agarivorans]AFU98055.2 MSHA biogenesis protein MshE [Simiduia agarivorans SA1 = DSM 21679]
MQTRQRIRIGDLLVSKGMITEAQLEQALQEQKMSGRKLGRTLVEMGYVDENAMLNLLSSQLKIPFVELKQFRFDRELIQTLPETQARRYRVMPLSENADGILLGMADPTDIFALDELQKFIKKPINPAVVRESELLDVLDIAYSHKQEIANLAEELDTELEDDAVDLADVVTDAGLEEAPVVKLLQHIFEDAINAKASDIHIEPDETVLRIRLRIDGVLTEQVMNERRIAAALVVRLKLMSGLNISEKRLPQDGRFNLRVKRRNIDVRLSTMPVQFGESVVMRLLDHTEGVRSLEQVGMPAHMLVKFRELIQRPNGLILVTGPTGSGKTTTLYGALSELNTPDKKIITVEDPVEYRLSRINQVQVHEKIGLDFERVLRATLRQDPDILLVGEIRDSASAEIALRAAMTGHLVLSTLHTNDAVTSALRLIDMGVDPYLVAASLKAIVAQRLVRRVCESCSAPYTPNANETQLIKIGQRRYGMQGDNLRKGAGCPHCFNTGYRGRIGVFELLEINHGMADALRENDVRAFNRVAHERPDFQPLMFSALAFALEGITTLEEVLRVSAQVEDEVDEVPEVVSQ